MGKVQPYLTSFPPRSHSSHKQIGHDETGCQRHRRRIRPPIGWKPFLGSSCPNLPTHLCRVSPCAFVVYHRTHRRVERSPFGRGNGTHPIRSFQTPSETIPSISKKGY